MKKETDIRIRTTLDFKKRVEQAAVYNNKTMTEIVTDSLNKYLPTILPQNSQTVSS